MSIFRLAANVDTPINSIYIQTCELVIQNLGGESFEILVQVSQNASPIHTSLHHVSPLYAGGSVITVGDMHTGYSPFSFLIVTSLLYTSTTALTLYVKDKGNLIALFTQNDFIKVE